MADPDDLDLSNMDGMDDIDWSDVESELKENREKLRTELDDTKDDHDSGKEIVPASSESTGLDNAGMEFLMGIPLQLTVEVGRTRLKIKDILDLDLGSIIELRKKMGKAMSVLISDKLVAKGEIVIQNEKFGLKITEIIDTSERLKKLKEA
jgi:flagellar motor switch protein FliN/FliY